MLNFLSANLVIAVLLLATLLVVVLLAVVVSAALRGAGPAAAEAGTPRLLAAESLRKSFRGAVRLIEDNLAARSERYKLSWTLLLNESATREVPLLQSGLSSALSTDSSLTAAAEGISWNFFDKGVVVQLRAGHLGSPNPDSVSSNGIWDDFLGLCRSYRPQRPFDSVVLALPCSALLAGDPQGQLDLAARAKAIHRRLWLAQNRLALRIPIHLVVTECEAMPGFASFGAALPEALRRSILGWASPHELAAPFAGPWVDAAMDQIVGAVADSGAELCALAPADADSGAYFLLPTEVERLRAGLRIFCEELMRPSAYHEPFLLRGIYLSGDCGDLAALAPSAPAIDAPGGQPVAGAEAVPAFLRDIFERKIFAEVGLVHATSRRLRRPVAGRPGFWVALGVPAVWAVGLLVSTIELRQLSAEVVGYLGALGADSRASLQSAWAGAGRPGAKRASAASAERDRQRAVDALLNIEQLGAARLGSIFMPGSWSLFDPLHERVQQRLEQGFADNAFEPLKRGAFEQLGLLTGVPRDPITGTLIAGADCALPARWNEQAAQAAPAALNLEDLPHYFALLQYLDRVERLERVVGALMRLKTAGPQPASGADLALAVRVLLGAELSGTPDRTAALFRAVAQGAPSLALEPMQEAARCSLRKASQAMYQRLFDDNGLLRAEQVVAASAAGLRDGARHGSDLGARLQPWQALRGALDDQQRHLAAGKGGWMQQRALGLGAGHEAMLVRIGASSLLGEAAARQSQQLASQGFERFLTAWNGILSAPSAFDGGGAGAGLAWTEAKAGWAFAPQRQALHEALTALLAPPYMKADAPLAMAAVPPGATIVWDKGQLERAASLADARKAFHGGAYLKLPAALQPPASALVDLALAATARGALAQALSVAPAQLPSAANDAERAGVLRLRAWLEDIGERQTGAELDALLARDALSRLQRMDEVFNAAEVFIPREHGLDGWSGGKGPLLDAFAAGDAAGLGVYLAQQQEFIDIAARQVDGVLAQLAASGPGQPVVARWQAIVADLRRYRLKSPTSSLMALEQFILGGAEIDAGNCADKLGQRRASRRGGDVFAERLDSLHAALLGRCRALSAGQYQAAWERFAEAYNRDLGQRLPFAALAAGGEGGRAGAGLDADRDEVGAVVRLYDRARAAGAAAERDPGQPAAGAAVRNAAQQMRRVRDVLAPLFPPEEGQAGGLDVTVQFRANGAAEAGANQIIDWSLSIGGASARLADPARALRWTPGMPLVLALRLARDGAGVPLAEPGNAHMTVAERTVRYRFDDPWALFSFIAAHREVEPAGDDGRAPLLRFEFPVKNAGATTGLAVPDARARVFLRLVVSAAGGRTPLAWPALFPAQAPPWQAATADAARPPQAALTR
jgi:type VI secretion system protein ImpL